jgi:hypothetical protein
MTDADSGSRSNTSTTSPRVGTKVEVRTRFDGTWTRGFIVAGVADDGYRIKRVNDGTVLPSVFRDEEVRQERHRATW